MEIWGLAGISFPPLGKRRQQQTSLWVETSQLQTRGRHPFYSRVNEILDGAKFDTYAERICRNY